MKEEDVYLYGALAVGAYLIIDNLSNNKISSSIGNAVGSSVVNSTGNLLEGSIIGISTGTSGFFENVWNNAQNPNANYGVIDWVAKPYGEYISFQNELINKQGWFYPIISTLTPINSINSFMNWWNN